MENAENLNPDEISSDQDSDSSGKKEEKTLDQKGSSEFYQGERVIEDIALPGEKKNIKAETISKEEIYQDKIEKQKAFIVSLGRKKESGEKSDQGKPEYVEEKSPHSKKRLFTFLLVIVLAAAVGGGYWLWNNKKQKTGSKETGSSVIIPVNQETEPAASVEEQTAPESDQPTLIDPAKLKVKVLNEGAAAGTAGKVKTLLAGKGYAKAEAGNGELDSTGTFVYYSGQASSQDAEAVSKILSDNGTKAKAKEALTSEQKSADITVVLGKI
jgi:hypothetical protein